MSDSRISASAPTNCATSAEPVVVAEPDLVGGHGVVLVDDGHRVTCGAGRGCAGRWCAGPASRCRAPSAAPARRCGRNGRRPHSGVHQGHLPDAGRGPFGRQIRWAPGRSERFYTRRDGTRGDDDDIGAALHPSLDGVNRYCSRLASNRPSRVVSAVVPILTTTERAERMASRCALLLAPALVESLPPPDGFAHSSRPRTSGARQSLTPAGRSRGAVCAPPFRPHPPGRCAPGGCPCHGRSS